MSDEIKKDVSRREFLTGVGGLGLGAIIGGGLVKGFFLPDAVFAVEASGGYLLVDTMKCAGCESCMLACSLVNLGRENPALSRIQVVRNPFGGFPYDVAQLQCRQCPHPSCVEACPTGAMHVDAANGNVRTVDDRKCIGCERCLNACPLTPSRVQWNFEDRKAQKCDLCSSAPYWSQQGGPEGKQACVESCPMRAITFTKEIPVQGDEGYEINLRNEHWANLGFPADDDGREILFAKP